MLLLLFCIANSFSLLFLTVSPESVIIVMFLITVHVIRRLSECVFLSVYSDSKMNLIHYLLGYFFYFGVGLSAIAEAPGINGRGN